MPPKGTRLETELRAVGQCTPELMQEASRDWPLESDPAVTITDPGAAPPAAATTAAVSHDEVNWLCTVQFKSNARIGAASAAAARVLGLSTPIASSPLYNIVAGSHIDPSWFPSCSSVCT